MATQLHRVVVTGLGAVSPYGVGAAALWRGLAEEPPAIRRITLCDVGDVPVHIAAEVPDFDPLAYLDRKVARRSARFVQFGVVAAQEALRDAEFPAAEYDEVGVYAGCSGALFDAGEQVIRHRERGWRAIDPLFIAREGQHMAAARIGLTLKLRGPSSTMNSACASGLDAINQAFNTVRLGQAPAMLAGGTEAYVNASFLGEMALMNALTKTHNDDPRRASRPFDRTRDGFVLGEGAGLLLLEALDHAEARGARIYGEIVGAGWSFDAADDTAPDMRGQVLAMRRALRDAGVSPDEIDAVKAHATSTELNDKTETAGLKDLLGERAYRVPVVAPKSKIGHSLAASGGVEMVAAMQMLERQTLTPTANLDEPDPECDLDYVTDGPRPARVDTMLVNAFGLGGQNVCTLLRRWA